MRSIAIIPARGGSTRLPGKNVRILGGKPLIAWTIQFAREVNLFQDVIVSTDSKEIATCAEDAGGWVPWLRPEVLSGGDIKTADVCLHALKWYEDNVAEVELVVTLQPTSPFRRLETFARGLEMFQDNPSQSTIGMKSNRLRLDWAMSYSNGQMLELSEAESRAYSLNGSNLYIPAGNYYFTNANLLRESNRLWKDKVTPLFSDFLCEEIDIDTQSDFELAALIAKNCV